MVEVFKTDVKRISEAKILLGKLSERFPHYKMNFDLSDCDKILRVEAENIFINEFFEFINFSNFKVEIL